MKADRDLVIIGAGAAGLSAAQYAARGGLDTLLLEELASGGQALVIDNLENYPGFPDPVNGFEFSQRMEQQAVRFGVEITNGTASAVRTEADRFIIETDRGPIGALTVILATGAKHRHLGVPGEGELAGKGVSYCATCDGPFFKGKKMLVVGGGDAACDESSYLANLASSVVMVHRRDKLRAQKALADRVLGNPKIDVRYNTELRRITGTGAVAGALLEDSASHRSYEEPLSAVFIFIGSDPQTALVRGLAGISYDDGGYIVTDQRMETGVPGLFAVGDVRATPFRQLVVAAGEGAVAAHVAGQYIEKLRRKGR